MTESAEIPGAREQLDRAGEWLRAQLHDLAAQLTPGQVPELPARDPVIADWHEPLRYQHQVTARVEREAAQNDRTAAARAAQLLAAAGWEVTQTVTEEGGVPRFDVVGTRDGFRLGVRFEEGFRGVVYTGETPMLPLYPAQEFAAPPPEKTAETVSPDHVLCYECRGLGWCPVCEGRGWTIGPDGREKCPECSGSRVCPVCGGRGESAIDALADWERDQYPELGKQAPK
jgi:hypothetical protein